MSQSQSQRPPSSSTPPPPAPPAPPRRPTQADAAASHPHGVGSGGSATEYSTRAWPIAADPAETRKDALEAIKARLTQLADRLAVADAQRVAAGSPPVLDGAMQNALRGASDGAGLERLRETLATRLDEDALAALQSAVVELYALEGEAAVPSQVQAQNQPSAA